MGDFAGEIKARPMVACSGGADPPHAGHMDYL